jgi:hypothetical protein
MVSASLQQLTNSVAIVRANLRAVRKTPAALMSLVGSCTAAFGVRAGGSPRCSHNRATRSFGRSDSPYSRCGRWGDLRGRSGDRASNSRAWPPRYGNRGFPAIIRSLSRMSGSPTTIARSSPTFWDYASTTTGSLATIANPLPTGGCGLSAIAHSRAAIDG